MCVHEFMSIHELMSIHHYLCTVHVHVSVCTLARCVKLPAILLLPSDQAYPLYIKGSNFIPMDAFLSRATPDIGLRLLTSVIEGNQNMIRVW